MALTVEYDRNYLQKPTGYYSVARNEMVSYIPPGVSRILEVGCGDGSFGSAVKEKYQCEYWGIEPHERSARLAEKELDKTFNSVFSPGLLPDHYFDCIVFNDVLEHLMHPDKVLSEVKSKLQGRGFIVASIPNFLNYQNVVSLFKTEDFQYGDYGILDRTHLRFFTKKSIERLFLEGGFTIKTIEGINQNTSSLKYKLINALMLNKLYNYRFLQFAIVAQRV